MKISYVSDLHLEFGGNVELPGGDLLLLAGDITVVDGLQKNNRIKENLKRFIEQQVSKYKQTLIILGNHEHYHGNIDQTFINLCDWIGFHQYHTIHLLEDTIFGLEAFGIKNWLVYGATMWTDYNKNNDLAKWDASRKMNDHAYITKTEGKGTRRFSPNDAYDINQKSTIELIQAVEEFSTDNFIVMTHHTPDMKSCHEKWNNGNLLNYAFHNTQLSKVVTDHPNIKYWIHGHTHDNMDYNIGDCRVLCNPRGYYNFVNQTIENKDFDPNKHFEVT
jgi:hypothetical protein